MSYQSANSNNKNQGTGRTKPWDVLTVTEKGDQSFWTKVGAAFKNDNGSFTVLLDALPVNGKLVIKQADRPRKS